MQKICRKHEVNKKKEQLKRAETWDFQSFRDRSKLEMRKDVAIENKFALTVEEMAAYSNIGVNKIKFLSDSQDCPFVLWVGNKRLIKRQKFEEFLAIQYSI